jgi:hypothetical protein
MKLCKKAGRSGTDMVMHRCTLLVERDEREKGARRAKESMGSIVEALRIKRHDRCIPERREYKLS